MLHRVTRSVLTCSALLVLASGCWNQDDAAPGISPQQPPTTAHPTGSPKSEAIVIAISVDGLNPDAITELGRHGAPALWRLVDEGAATFNARSAYELTLTLPNHVSMLTGRPIDGQSGTSVTFNDDTGGTLHDTHGAYVPGVFDVAHDNGLRTALFAEKAKFDFLLRSWDQFNGAVDRTGKDDGRDKVDIEKIGTPDELRAGLRQALGADSTQLVFWHIAAPDVSGHDHGWLSPAYFEAVEQVDDQLAELLALIDAEPQLQERVTVLLTADHGGSRGATHHGRPELLANHRVPFVAWGQGVRAGTNLYDLNPGRQDPGMSRPDYTGAQPVRNLDLADAALSLLDLPHLNHRQRPLVFD